jgi:hypothetical protein
LCELLGEKEILGSNPARGLKTQKNSIDIINQYF